MFGIQNQTNQRMNKKVIYVVEDDFDISEMIVLLLSDDNLTVNASSTLAGFRQLINAELPDLILMDIMLPDGNGMEACKEIKGSNDMKHIPLLLMSAHAQSEFVIKESPADGFIEKPFDIYHFTDRIKMLLN